jgi:hypothetical protein
VALRYPDHQNRKHDGLRVTLHLEYPLRQLKGGVRYHFTMEPALTRGIGIKSSSSSSRDAQKRSRPSLSDCTSVFVVAPNAEQTLCEIPTNLVVDPFRQKRLHHKSKRGCLQCRKRRVKVSPSSNDFRPIAFIAPRFRMLICANHTSATRKFQHARRAYVDRSLVALGLRIVGENLRNPGTLLTRFLGASHSYTGWHWMKWMR